MDDQKRVLVEEHDMSEEEAEQVYKSMKTQVMLLAQSAERDWDTGEYEAVTDVLMGIQHQQAEMVEQMEESHIATIARYLPKTLGVIGVGQLVVGVFLAVNGAAFIPTVTVLVAATVLLLSASVLS